MPARPAEIVMFAALGLAAAMMSAEPARSGGPSFTNDIVPLLTRAGCNQGACHGKGAGQNGFRLSLRGYAPELDHRWLTREFDGRRIDLADPAASLLLTKATGQVPHEGGARFPVLSAEYRVLRDWIAAGVPGPDKSHPDPVKLELTPDDRVLKPGETIPLKAWATFADGSRKDVTWLTRFDTNDVAVATVTPAGGVTAVRTGATAVRAMYRAEVAVCGVSVPGEAAVDPAKYAKRNNVIDEHVFPRLQELRIEPSADSTDGEFCRRAFLDACGRLPPPETLTEFLADQSPDKRSKLVAHLVQRSEFTDYWTLQLGELLQNRKERDHDVRGLKGVRQFHAWLREQVAANRPWDRIARDVLTAAGNTRDHPAVGYYVVIVGEHRRGEESEAAESVAQAFLGTRIGCAKCHNHPLERYTQDDFYHFAAFFSRVSFDRQESTKGPTTLRIGHPDSRENRRPVTVTQPRTGQPLPPRPLDRSTVTVPPGDDPRQSLADWMIGPAKEAFAAAMVNRVWKHYFAVGLVEPVDDLRATNPASLPALHRELAQRFIADGYDLRKLACLLMSSRAYQRSSATTANNRTDARFYSHYYARRLPAEVFLDALSDAADRPEEFESYPFGTRAVQLPDPTHGAGKFLEQFGRSVRTTACACEKAGDVTLPQLLHLQNSRTMWNKVHAADGWLATRLKSQPDDDKLLDELYLRTLARVPRPAERDAVKRLLAEDRPQRPAVFADLFWAVLNAKEFGFNR